MLCEILSKKSSSKASAYIFLLSLLRSLSLSSSLPSFSFDWAAKCCPSQERVVPSYSSNDQLHLRRTASLSDYFVHFCNKCLIFSAATVSDRKRLQLRQTRRQCTAAICSYSLSACRL